MSFGNFSDQKPAYKAFVKDLHRRVARQAKGARFRAGNRFLYGLALLAVVMLVVGALVLGYAILFAPTLPRFAPLASVVLAMPIIVMILKQGRPRAYGPAELDDLIG